MKNPAAQALLLASCLLTLFINFACSRPDPLQDRLNQRGHYQVDVVSFSPASDGRFLVELEVRAGMGQQLVTLTATLKQHAAEGEVLSSQRVPLDLSQMDATGVLRVFARLEPAAEVIAGMSATIERSPPRSQWADFPEIFELAGGQQVASP